MGTPASTPPPPEDGPREPWHVAARIQAAEGEAAANRLRLVTVALFYAIELLNRYGLDLGFLRYPAVEGVDADFHAAITAACVAWVGLAWVVGTCLRRRYFPPSLGYVSAAGDAVVLTAVLLVADGPASPLVVAFLLLPPLAALRLDPALVRFATGTALAGYAVLLGNARWFRPALRAPRHHQLIFAVSLVLCGVFLVHAIRRVRAMAGDFARVQARDAAEEGA